MHAASRVFGALISAGRRSETNHDEGVEFSVRTAVDLVVLCGHAAELRRDVVERGDSVRMEFRRTRSEA